jgi:hypothetical protein
MRPYPPHHPFYRGVGWGWAVQIKKKHTGAFCPNPSEIPRRSFQHGVFLLNDISKSLPKPANDNVYAERWPILEEYLAKRLGKNATENEHAWECAMYVGEVWNRFRENLEPHFSPGTFRLDGGVSSRCFGDPSLLRGAEWTAHAYSLWTRVDRVTNGRFWLVKRAIVDRAEMKDLAPDIRNRAKRAEAGRQRLIEALPIVAEEIRLLDVADAA